MLDTYSMIKKLQAAGVPEKQAEAQVAMVFEVAEKTFATKADTNKLGADVNGLAENVNRLGTEVTKLGTDVNRLGTEVTKLDTEVTRLGTEVTKLGTDVNRLGTEVTKLGENLKACATKDDLKAYATKENLEALENRLIIKLGGLMTGLMILGFAFLKYAH